MDLKLSDNAFSLTILILLSGKVTEMDEIDFDYEEPSLDSFEGEFSGSDDSENEDEPAVVNRDSLENICHQHSNTVFSLKNHVAILTLAKILVLQKFVFAAILGAALRIQE